jgi:hypothetical protein
MIHPCHLIFLTFLCFAVNMCLVDDKQSIAVPIIAKDQELVHFNSLWCTSFMTHPCHLIFLTFFVLQKTYALSMASSLLQYRSLPKIRSLCTSTD